MFNQQGSWWREKDTYGRIEITEARLIQPPPRCDPHLWLQGPCLYFFSLPTLQPCPQATGTHSCPRQHPL